MQNSLTVRIRCDAIVNTNPCKKILRTLKWNRIGARYVGALSALYAIQNSAVMREKKTYVNRAISGWELETFR